MAILDVVLGPTQGDRLWSIPVAWCEGDRCWAVADLGVVGIVVREGDRHVVDGGVLSTRLACLRPFSLTWLVEPVALIMMPGTSSTIDHTDRYAGVRHGGVVAVTGGADTYREGRVLVSIDAGVFNRADRDGLGDVPVAGGEGDGGGGGTGSLHC